MLVRPENPDGVHARRPRRLDTGQGILDDEAALWRYAQPSCRYEITFRVRLSVRDLVGADENRGGRQPCVPHT